MATRPPPFRRQANAPLWIAGPRPGPTRRTEARIAPRPRVLPLSEPRRLFGSRGPIVVAITDDAADELKAKWGVN
jgi:hypothetical protein